MLVNRYYVVYVEVPSGRPGVDLIDIPFGASEDIRVTFFNAYNRAVLDILEAK